MMIEPTESESRAELDRFCDAMISIHGEIRAIQNGEADAADNVLINAPHTAEAVTADEWPHPYSRQSRRLPGGVAAARANSGRRSAGSTTSTATATSCAPARVSRPTRNSSGKRLANARGGTPRLLAPALQ